MIPFHLALTVADLDDARTFYCQVLGCTPTRQAARWQDIDFFGHQLSLHLPQPSNGTDSGQTTANNHNEDADRTAPAGHPTKGVVDGVAVPMPHFGVVLDIERWNKLVDRILRKTTDKKHADSVATQAGCIEPRCLQGDGAMPPEREPLQPGPLEPGPLDTTDGDGSPFVVEPQRRFVGETFEQSTFFIADPSGNHIECKGIGPDVDLLAPTQQSPSKNRARNNDRQ